MLFCPLVPVAFFMEPWAHMRSPTAERAVRATTIAALLSVLPTSLYPPPPSPTSPTDQRSEVLHGGGGKPLIQQWIDQGCVRVPPALS